MKQLRGVTDDFGGRWGKATEEATDESVNGGGASNEGYNGKGSFK